MLRYMQALVKVVVKNPLFWVLILVCQLLLVAPFIKGDATMGYFLGKEELDVALRESRKNMEEGVYDSAPSEVRERAQERIGLMTRACLTDDPRNMPAFALNCWKVTSRISRPEPCRSY
ncbi:MAG: hypothetical protein ACLTSX_03980 [Collinsella sp.]